MKESKFVKTKMVAGYVLLIAVCVLAVGYVYRVVVRFSAPDSSYVQLQTKHSAVSRTLYHLYQAESYGQLMIAGYQSYEARYKRELRTVRACIDSLRSLTGDRDSLQTMRLDSITRLLADKERRTMSLRRTIRAGSTAKLLDKNIRDLIGPQQGIVADTTPFRRIVRQDTTAVPRSRRRFLQRLGDLFSPPKEDSSVVISRRELVAPAVPAGSVKDTITLVLRALQDSVTSNRLGIYDRAWQEGLRLSYSNELVNTKIYRLIMDFEAEDTEFLMRRIERTEAFRRRSSRVLGGVTVGAVVLVLLFVGILWRDISRSNRYRRELEQANRDKEALLAAREKLMLAITHDIKAPLGSVMGYIDLLSRLTDDKRQELYLHNMKDSSEHLLALVNSLLDFYRLDINKIEVARVAFSPAQLFETIRAGFAAAAAAKGLELRLETGPDAARTVTGDAFHIRQIADNLVSNALKFTNKGSVTLRADVRQGRLVFSVRDTGRGIGREEKERIFGEFVRLSSAQGVDGFGLGLSIVDRLVKLLEGTISLESRLGEGSKFIVSVPVGEAGPAAVQEVREPEPPQPGLRVLLIDDDPLQLEMTAAMCRRAGIAAECCQVSRIRRQTGRRRPLRSGADRHTDALGRRIQRAESRARGRSRAARGRRVGPRGAGRRGFHGPRIRRMSPQTVRIRRTARRGPCCLRRGGSGSGRIWGPGGGGGGFRSPDGLCGRRCRCGAEYSGLLRRTDRGQCPGARKGGRKRRCVGGGSLVAQDAADLHDARRGGGRRHPAPGREPRRAPDRRAVRRIAHGDRKNPRDCRGSRKNGNFVALWKSVF